jgi:hypothetical protein
MLKKCLQLRVFKYRLSMDTKIKDISIDELIGGIFSNDEDSDTNNWREREGITFWVSPTAKQKYRKLQDKSKRKFHDALRVLIMNTIDRVYINEENNL